MNIEEFKKDVMGGKIIKNAIEIIEPQAKRKS